MKQPKYPVIATTMEALEALLKQEYGIIYVDEFLLAEEQERIIQMMDDHEYVIPEKKGKKGMFYVKETGPFAFDSRIHEIYDPYNSL